MNFKLFYRRYCNTPFKRLLFWSAIGFTSFVLLLFTSVYLLQDRIIQRFVHDANQHLAVRVDAPTIDVTALPNFPDVSISFSQLTIFESGKQKPDTLAHFETLYFTFNLWDLVEGNYQLHQLYAENGRVSMRTNKKGEHNFEIIKPKPNTENNSDQHFSFKLNRIRLKNVAYAYIHDQANQAYQLQLSDVVSKLIYHNQFVENTLEGSCYIEQILLGEQAYSKEKTLAINSKITYDLKGNGFTIHPSSVKIGKANFDLEGVYEGADHEYLYLKLNGKQANFQTLLAFSPTAVRKQLSKYKTRGETYFTAEMDGSLKDNRQPKISVNFGCKHVSLAHPDSNGKVENLSFSGFFSNGAQQSLSSSTLQLDSIQGLLNGQDFRGNFKLSNFKKPIVTLNVKTQQLAEDILAFYPLEAIEKATGKIAVDLQLSGDLTSIWNFKATGAFSLKGLSVKVASYPNTVLIDTSFVELKTQQLVIHPSHGKIGDSDFMASGNIKFWNKLLSGDWMAIQPKLNLTSQKLDFNQLIPKNSGEVKIEGQTSNSYTFPQFDLKLDIQELIYDQWMPKQVKGSIKSAAAGQLRFSNLAAQLLEGNVTLNGLLELDQTSSLYAGSAEMAGINVKTLFQQFNDFDLDAISYKNLEGKLNAYVSAQLIFDQEWNVKWELMDAVIAGNIRQGKLINYEPMERLALFMHNKNLESISFSELTDTIFINHNTLTLPKMQIHSSVGELFISGTQVIDGPMEYHLQVPLKNFKKPDKDEAFGAIEDDGLGNGSLFLVIKGTTTDYKIAYDKKEVITKIKDDLKKEKKEFSSLFKKKQKEKQVGLKKDYFR